MAQLPAALKPEKGKNDIGAAETVWTQLHCTVIVDGGVPYCPEHQRRRGMSVQRTGDRRRREHIRPKMLERDGHGCQSRGRTASGTPPLGVMSGARRVSRLPRRRSLPLQPPPPQPPPPQPLLAPP